ncbi:hypothetical protein QBC43DRAFT_284531 [Cladorrhinum sp. PSN259]|nr:hypothetical protein QBC43DRAFT_284531 [Cladorrhinum sp. PSN259]
MSIFARSLRVRPAFAGLGRRPLVTSLPARRSFPAKPILTQLLPQQAGTSQRVFFHVSRSEWARPHNVIFGCATNSNEFYGPMKSTDMPLILLYTSSVSEVSWKVSEVVHELVMSRVGEAEGGVALMEVAFDAPGIAHEDLGWIYSVDGAPTLVVIDPKWSDPMDDARLTDTAKLLDREFLKEFIKDIARRGKEIRDGGDQK